jgi:hypothetical protein
MKSCENNYFDFIYIDTTHTYEQTLNELEISFLKCKVGGYVRGHDLDINVDRCVNPPYSFQVDKAVYEFCTKYSQKIYAISLDGCISFAIKKCV